MTLAQFLATLDGNKVLVTVSDINGEIIKFYSGTNALDDALEARIIVKWSLAGATAVNVILNAE